MMCSCLCLYNNNDVLSFIRDCLYYMKYYRLLPIAHYWFHVRMPPGNMSDRRRLEPSLIVGRDHPLDFTWEKFIKMFYGLSHTHIVVLYLILNEFMKFDIFMSAGNLLHQ